MLTKNERMSKLNNAGVDTNKYFNVSLPNGLKPGATISLVINEDGQPVIVGADANDFVADQIIEDGYVRNSKLHRRFIMAQMFSMLNYKSYDGSRAGYNDALKRFGIKYTFDMMLEEIRVLSKLEERDEETFIERAHFFTKEVIVKTMEDYVVELGKHICTLPTKHCKGIPYKRIKGKDVFVVDIPKKVYGPLRYQIDNMKYVRNYNQIYMVVKRFINNMISLPYNTPKSKAWIDAYKGEGAFYTLRNLVMFHNCGIEVNGRMVYGIAATNVLNAKLDEYQGEGWRMFALMKKVIADNKFDFAAKMAEIYGE